MFRLVDASFLSRLLIVAALSLSGLRAQIPTPIAYGDYRSGTISAAGQVARFSFVGAAGDVLRVSFGSEYYGYPTSQYIHRLDVRLGAAPVGGPIDGIGTLTQALTSSGTYLIEVRARNNQWTGWYGFRLDKLNPSGGDKTAFYWNNQGSIAQAGTFETYTIWADANSVAALHFTSEWWGYPYNLYIHYAEVLDAAGNQIETVVGNGTSATFTFPSSGYYTIFIASRDFTRTGWYSVDLQCMSTTPCATQAEAFNFGQGFPGTLSTPALTAQSLPLLGSNYDLFFGNSSGQSTSALFVIGFDRDNTPVAGYGGTLLVGSILSVLPLALPAGGAPVSIPLPGVPGASFLIGLGMSAQLLVLDGGALPGGWAFSRGLGSIFG
ncbi:MAG TPA: hypothetical protein VFD82_01020 [Planctomycetota bacterium]|nr:hypothetical protein [Planctomycetota bacterium]